MQLILTYTRCHWIYGSSTKTLHSPSPSIQLQQMWHPKNHLQRRILDSLSVLIQGLYSKRPPSDKTRGGRMGGGRINHPPRGPVEDSPYLGRLQKTQSTISLHSQRRRRSHMQIEPLCRKREWRRMEGSFRVEIFNPEIRRYSDAYLC